MLVHHHALLFVLVQAYWPWGETEDNSKSRKKMWKRKSERISKDNIQETMLFIDTDKT